MFATKTIPADGQKTARATKRSLNSCQGQYVLKGTPALSCGCPDSTMKTATVVLTFGQTFCVDISASSCCVSFLESVLESEVCASAYSTCDIGADSLAGQMSNLPMHRSPHSTPRFISRDKPTAMTLPWHRCQISLAYLVHHRMDHRPL